MKRWLAVHNRSVLLAAGLLCGATGTISLKAQAPAPARAQAQAGPRVAAPMPRFEPSIAQTRTPAYAAAADLNDSHTIVFSTLGLILVAVILILLLA